MNNRLNTHGIARAPASEHLRLGNFGMLLPEDPPIPTWAEEFGIAELAAAENIEERVAAENIANVLGGRDRIMHDARGTSGNSDIPAAYTFFAQFVDHDITLDAESELTSEALTREQVEQLPNLRSASLDLDSVYGFGPDVSPHLYDREQPWRLLVGSQVGDVENPNDVPRRADGTALIGDPRNDENIFLSQMHLLFLRFHNRRIIDLLIRRDNRRGEDANQQPPPLRFEDVQKDVRYHYQALVLYDFLRRICDVDVYNFALQKIQENANRPEAERDYPFFLRHHLIDESGRLRMPVEFSAAAYRFGHTLVRSNYPANSTYPRIEIFDERFRTTGLSPIPPELTVDWRFLLDVDPNQVYARSKAIDHLLADELARLPLPVAGRDARPQDRSLAFRNLLRGYVLGLPSGQQVAEALLKEYGIDSAQDLEFNKIPGWKGIDKDLQDNLAKHTPLFLYLMREAGVRGSGNRLGPVGSAILMEVFGAMLVHRSHADRTTSFLMDEEWDADHNLVDENVAENRGEPDNANGSQSDNEDGNEAEGARHPNAEKVTLASLVRYVGGTSRSR